MTIDNKEPSKSLLARSGYLNEGICLIYLCGNSLYTDVYIYIGTAMDPKKRQELGLNGLLPAKIETLDIQKKRCLHVLRSKSSMLEKYILLAQLRTSNVRLFYKIVMDELEVNCYFHIHFAMTNSESLRNLPPSSTLRL